MAASSSARRKEAPDQEWPMPTTFLPFALGRLSSGDALVGRRRGGRLEDDEDGEAEEDADGDDGEDEER